MLEFFSFEPKNTRSKDVSSPDFELEIQREIVPLFVKNNRKKFIEITEALEEDDVKTAHRLAHNLKGNAGQLGKTALQQAAAEVEHLLKDGKNQVTEEQLKILEIELIAAIEELTPLIAELSQNKNQTVDFMEYLDVKTSLELIGKLELLLDMGNPECQEYVTKIRQIPESGGLKIQLIEQMDNMDFEQAIVTLAELKKRVTETAEQGR